MRLAVTYSHLWCEPENLAFRQPKQILLPCQLGAAIVFKTALEDEDRRRLIAHNPPSLFLKRVTLLSHR